MAEAFNLLETVKSALGITGNYQDATLSVYIDDVNSYLRSAGVPESLINTKASAGTVARGVADIWNYGSGDGKLSSYFYERVIQLARTRISATIEPSVPDQPDEPDQPNEPDTPDEPEPVIRLPEGYKELKYVIANPVVGATVYLDTDIVPNANTSAEYAVEPSAIAVNGSHTLSSGSVFMCTLQRAAILINRLGNTAVLPEVPRVNTKYEIVDFKGDNIAKINEHQTTVLAGAQVSSGALMLGCYGGAISDSSYWFMGKVYEVKIYESAVMLRDFVPAQRTSDNKVGFYDLVSETFFTSSGSGDYEAGEAL